MSIFATHSGIFHADDVAAFVIFDTATEPDGCTLVRSRNPDDWKDADIVVDVGGGQFDHHQRGGNGARANGIKYAAAGLVWQKFGARAVENVLIHNDKIMANSNAEGSPASRFDAIAIHEVAERVEQMLIMPIDAADNGQMLRFPLTRDEAICVREHMDPECPAYGELEHGLYERLSDYWESGPNAPDVCPVSLSAVISHYNPQDDDADPMIRDTAFTMATNVFTVAFESQVLLAFKQLMAVETVRKAASFHPGPFLVLEDRVPWQEAVFKLGLDDLLYVVFKGIDGEWMVQCVPTKLGSFTNRKSLPADWAGLRDEDFDMATDLSDGIFCHTNRFICGAKTLPAAMRLVNAAIESPELISS